MTVSLYVMVGDNDEIGSFINFDKFVDETHFQIDSQGLYIFYGDDVKLNGVDEI